MVRVALVSLLASALACGPAVSTTETGGEAVGVESSGDTRGSATTDDPTVGTASDPTSATVATSATTVDPTGTPATCATDWVIGCQSYCAAIVTCDPENGPFEDCVNQCTMELLEDSPECQVAWCEAYSCSGALDCATLDAGDPTCDALWAEADVCAPATECVGFTGLRECDLTCTNPDRSIRCAADFCDCFEGDFKFASCEITGACEVIETAAQQCCGW